MSTSTSKYVSPYVTHIPGNEETLPPKDGLFTATTLMGGSETKFIWWDATWGGRGGWFTADNKAVAEKSIFMWEKRIKEAPNFLTVSALNYKRKDDLNQNLYSNGSFPLL